MLDDVFATWSADPSSIVAEARAAYRHALDPSTIAAMCADYRASFHIDRGHDAEDREAGRRITAPLLLVTGEEEAQLANAPAIAPARAARERTRSTIARASRASECRAIWRVWAHDVTATEVPGRHVLPEEAPRELTTALAAFLGPAQA